MILKFDLNNKHRLIPSFFFSRGLKYKKQDNLLIDHFTHSVIIGTLLGDSRVDKQKVNYNARLCFEQGELHKDYLFHLFDIFKPFCSMDQPSFRTKFHKKSNKNNYSFLFKTLSYPCFNIYHSLFYPNHLKIVPNNISDLLNPISLAYWAMDDGTNDRSGFIFCTDAFSLEEVLFLIQVFKSKFDLDSSLSQIRLNQYRIYIKANSKIKFKELVQPYFHPSMLYKLS